MSEQHLFQNCISEEIVFPADGQDKRYGYKSKHDAIGCNCEFIRTI